MKVTFQEHGRGKTTLALTISNRPYDRTIMEAKERFLSSFEDAYHDWATSSTGALIGTIQGGKWLRDRRIRDNS